MSAKYNSIICNLNTSMYKNICVTYNAHFLDQTDSSSITTGGMIIKGGLGIAKNLNIGKELIVVSNTNILGNMNITSNLNVSQNINVGTLRLIGGAITDTSGSISFGNENLLTTGNVGIGTTTALAGLDILKTNSRSGTHSTENGAFYATYNSGEYSNSIAEFRYSDGTRGVGIGYGGVFSTGSNSNSRLIVQSKGTGDLLLNSYDGGNVGIGTNNPTKKLHIVGNQPGIGNSTHFDIEIGDYDNTTYYKMVSLGTDQNGSYNSGGISIWQNGSVEAIRLSAGNSQSSYFNNGNVGIGTSNPLYKLHIDTTGSVYGFVHSNLSVQLGTQLTSSAGYFGTKSNHNLYFSTNDTTRMTIDTSGYVGIGLSEPLSRLSVYTQNAGTSGFGVDEATSFLGCGDSANDYYFGAYIGADTGGGNSYIQSGFLDYRPGTPTNTAQYNLILQPTTGNVGIGTITPSYKLDVHSGASTYAIRFRNNTDTDGWLFRILADNKFSIHQENVGDRMIFDNGDVGIGITPSYQLHLNTDSAGKPSTNTWTITSDIRIKQNITTIPKEELFNISKKFEPKRYKFKENYRKAHKIKDKCFVGVIADEVAEYMPCCVDKNDLKIKIGEDDEGNDINEDIKDCYSYNGSELQFILFGCIPHLIKENEEQQTALEKQSKVIDNLLERIELLENK